MDEDATWYTKVGLGPGRIVLYGDPAPLPKEAQPPIYICYGQVARWSKMQMRRNVNAALIIFKKARNTVCEHGAQ